MSDSSSNELFIINLATVRAKRKFITPPAASRKTLAEIFMKYVIIIIVGLLTLTNSAFGQNTDTLRVYILTPYKIEVSENFKQEYNSLQKEVIEKRKFIREEKTKEKEANIDEFNKQPDYTKLMFDNELNFYDRLTVDNYISLLVREYIAYRLYKPFKIKPRLVFVVDTKLENNLDEYLKFSKGQKNTFIINVKLPAILSVSSAKYFVMVLNSVFHHHLVHLLQA